MEIKRRLKTKSQIRSKQLGLQRRSQPRKVCSALRRLLVAVQHVEARGVAFESSIHQLREKEQTEAVKKTLKALARSSAGDLTRIAPGTPGDPRDEFAQSVMESLIEAFDIKPVRKMGDVIAVNGVEPPASVDLDRPLDGTICSAFEVVSVGWSRNGRILIKPCVRPITNTNACGTTSSDTSQVVVSNSGMNAPEAP